MRCLALGLHRFDSDNNIYYLTNPKSYKTVTNSILTRPFTISIYRVKLLYLYATMTHTDLKAK